MGAYMYNLTSLTGRKRNVGRTVIVNGFEFNRRTLIVTGIAVGASIFPTVILSAFFGPIASVLTPAVFLAAAFLLFESRTRKGLQVAVYRSILDKRKAKTDEIYICWRPVSEQIGAARISASSAPRIVSDDTPTAVFVAPQKATTRVSVADIMEDPNS